MEAQWPDHHHRARTPVHPVCDELCYQLDPEHAFRVLWLVNGLGGLGWSVLTHGEDGKDGRDAAYTIESDTRSNGTNGIPAMIARKAVGKMGVSTGLQHWPEQLCLSRTTY